VNSKELFSKSIDVLIGLNVGRKKSDAMRGSQNSFAKKSKSSLQASGDVQVPGILFSD
jgi:hypothetical protein